MIRERQEREVSLREVDGATWKKRKDWHRWIPPFVRGGTIDKHTNADHRFPHPLRSVDPDASHNDEDDTTISLKRGHTQRKAGSGTGTSELDNIAWLNQINQFGLTQARLKLIWVRPTLGPKRKSKQRPPKS